MRSLALAACLVGAWGGSVFAADEFVYTVQAGDHPWNIAQRFLKDGAAGPRLSRLNRIPNDRRIPPGTRLRIPADWLRMETSAVRLLTLHGDVQVMAGATPVRAAQERELLPANTQLRTGAQSSALLEFQDGSRVLVRQHTDVRLTSAQQRVLDKASQVEVELLRGGIENLVRPGNQAPGRFEIRSPSAVAAVRGTTFRVAASDSQTWTEVLEGAVQVSNAAGETTATGGMGTLAQAGRTPGTPVPLLGAPDLSSLPAVLERLPIDWPVPAIAGAVAYRSQIALDKRFDAMLSDTLSTAPRVRATDVPDGDYVLRVRGVDAQGLEGLSAERPLVLRARPVPPLLIEPAPDAVTVSERPPFRWTQGPSTWHYRLQLSAGSETTPPLQHDQTVTTGATTTASIDLPAGIYRWRVASIDTATGRQGPWGDAQSFRRVLPGPGVEVPQMAAGGVTLRWSAQAHTRVHRVQVAREGNFDTVLFDAETSTPQYTLQGLAAGTYHVRVLSIGTDGFAGPWGTVQTFAVPEPAPEPDHWKALLLLVPALLLIGL